LKKLHESLSHEIKKGLSIVDSTFFLMMFYTTKERKKNILTRTAIIYHLPEM
jgi:hypothetical protein